MNRADDRHRDAKSAETEDSVSPPRYVTIAKTERSARAWVVCGLFENVYDASDAPGSMYGVSALVCRLIPISRVGDGEARTCGSCGESFEPVRYNQAYCNPTCRRRAEIVRRRNGPRRRSKMV